jgi:hypothetical protein
MSEPTSQPRPTAVSVPSGPIGVPKPPPTYSADRDIHLLDRLAILCRYRRVSGAVFVLTTLVLMIRGYSNVTRYEAQARLLIEQERTTAVPGITSAIDAYWEDPIPYYNPGPPLPHRIATNRIVPPLVEQETVFHHALLVRVGKRAYCGTAQMEVGAEALVAVSGDLPASVPDAE